MTNTWDTEAASASGFVPLARERPVSTEKKQKRYNLCHGTDGMNGATSIPNFRSPCGGWIRLIYVTEGRLRW